ncbi:unnamed protein product [Nesidiocoris tenuis]|uniref:Uncharacterized protein n=1 Tax=Nesidiocoris tenuis TaxID=355587 RepID=A0A6H5HS47_9HEMI|nr:unnamed protein product [Nesidiocoris tenuis]
MQFRRAADPCMNRIFRFEDEHKNTYDRTETILSVPTCENCPISQSTAAATTTKITTTTETTTATSTTTTTTTTATTQHLKLGPRPQQGQQQRTTISTTTATTTTTYITTTTISTTTKTTLFFSSRNSSSLLSKAGKKSFYLVFVPRSDEPSASAKSTRATFVRTNCSKPGSEKCVKTFKESNELKKFKIGSVGPPQIAKNAKTQKSH